MSIKRSYGLLLASVVGSAAVFSACGGSKSSDKASGAGASNAGVSGSTGSAVTSTGAGGEGGSDGGSGGSVNLMTPTLTSISIVPANASMTVVNGAPGTQQFQVIQNFSDGSTASLPSGAGWGSNQLSVGAVDPGSGLYTANGSLGGVVSLQASYMGMTATASLTVKVLVQENPAMAATATQGSLQGASTNDTTVTWAYPYDATVWPRGLAAPVFQWNGGAATDTYFVHLTSPTYELQAFTTATGAPSSQLQLSATDWAQFTDSTVGAAQLVVARWDGANATVITQESWTIAPASLRGTVYYWANNLGRVMRLDPGSTATDFSNGVVPAETQGCTMACHTVAANGSAMSVAGGTFGGTYDLQNNSMGYPLGGAENSGQIRQWGLAAMSPKGDIVVDNALMDPLTGLQVDGVFSASDGTLLADAGLNTVEPSTVDGGLPEQVFMPAFSPDGSGFVFVTGTVTSAGFWDSTGAPGATAPTDPSWGWLKAYDFNDGATPMFSNERALIGPGADPTANVIAWPTVTADGAWAIYGRLGWVDPSTQHNLSSYAPVNSDLYIASTKTPGVEMRLANVDGDNTNFAAGSRDLHLNFEPSLAPVAAGGYFWVVFHSRRTYGNTLTGAAASTKQLWVAAIDQNPKPGKDPSHAAFWLPGQDTTSINMRGFFSLPPCAADGAGCMTGTDCCGGYCNAGDDGGAPVCQSMSTTTNGCSQDGNACTTSSDCCNTTDTCINHVCSEPTPQ